MRKKLFTLLLAVAAGVGTMFAWDYENVQIGDLYYNLDPTNQTAEVTSQYGSCSGDIIIPSSVTYYDEITYSVTSIGESAFLSCSGLTSVTIPNTVTSIGNEAFSNCFSLTTITIPNSVTSIGDDAFFYCTGLTSVTIPNSVTDIGYGAFQNCTSLTSVTIPNSVTSIGESAFAFCDGLTSINVASDNPNYCSVNGVLFNKNRTTLISYPGGKQGAYSIPNSVTSIGSYAFYGCSGLTSVTIPGSVTSIGNKAFYECTGLTSVTIGNSVTSIGLFAFYGCRSLTSVTIPGSVTSIGNNAFSGCTGLISIDVASDNLNYCSEDGVLFNKDKTTLIQYPGGKQGAYTMIPNSVTSIGYSAFYECTGLTSVTIPNSVTSIEYGAFLNCTSLTSVTIPGSVTSIGGSAFSGCIGLTSVTCFATRPPQLDYGVFFGVFIFTPCVLYVPAGSVSAYKSADQWKDFTDILPIGAQPADVTTTTVTPSETTADIAWPQVTGAATYTIEIKKNGELICTLTFNAQGQLISIAFNAPSRNNAPQRAQAAGFAFTVTSLDSGTTYSYTMTAKGNNGNVLKTESGSFTTTGESQGIEDVLSNQVRGTKLLRDGQIFILRGEKVYTLQGQEVK